MSDQEKNERLTLTRLSSFPELNPNPVMEVDSTGTVTYINPAGRRLFPDIVEMGLNHPYLSDVENMAFVFAGNDNNLSVREIKIADVWYEQQIYFVRAERSIRIYGHDISGRKKIEESLKESEQRYRALLDSVTDAMVVHGVNADGSPSGFLEVNDVACQRLGYTHSELLMMSPADIDISPPPRYVLQRVAEGKSVIFEQVHVTKDKRLIPVEIHARAFFLQGRPAVISMVRDITERKKEEKERKQLIHQLQNALADVKTLKGLLPICAWCNKVRDDKGDWNRIEEYISKHSEASFSHGICPECAKKVLSEEEEK